MKQIVGGTLSDSGEGLVTNFVSPHPPEYFADRYREDGLTGGHVIMLGGGNEDAARRALAEWPGGLQIGGGIRADNAALWLEAGASHVVVTSWLFSAEGVFLPERLAALSAETGPERLVVDLSCRRRPDSASWTVCMNRWQTWTTLDVTAQTLADLAPGCSEFLIHAADVEGKCAGMDGELIAYLAEHSPLPVTYAGGARGLEDLALAERLSAGRVDVTIGSALDIFGGNGARYTDCVAWNRRSP